MNTRRGLFGFTVAILLIGATMALVDFGKEDEEWPSRVSERVELREQVESAFADWVRTNEGDLSENPCEARLRRNRFEVSFRKYWEESPYLDEETKSKLIEKHLDFQEEFALAVLRERRAGRKLVCNDLPESLLLEEALSTTLDVPVDEALREEYKKVLREEIDLYRSKDPYGPQGETVLAHLVEALIENAEKKFGISREELGR